MFGQYRFDLWTTDNGLPQNGVRNITQTPDGYLWFTTFDGLVRFDGVQFTTFNKSNTKGIINNRFTGLYGDKNGTLYATTMEDGVLTIYRNGTFTSMTSEEVPGHYINRIEPDENGELRFLCEDEARTSKSWYYLRDGKFVFHEKQNTNQAKLVYQGKSGAQWTLSATEIVERRGEKTNVYPIKLGKIDFRTSAFEDSAENLWIGGNIVYRLKDGNIEQFSENDGFPNNSIYHSFWEEKDGSVWFASGGSSSSGIGLLQYKDGKMNFWGGNQQLANKSILSVFKDREGTVWLATNKGLSRLRKEIIHGYNAKDGIEHSEVYPLFRDSKDDIWIGTNKGLSIYRNGKFETLDLQNISDDLPPEKSWRKDRMSVQSLWEDANGKMWIGLNGGIFLAQNGKAEILESGEGHHVFAIRGDRAGNIWAATNKGILQFRDYGLVASYSVKDSLPNEFMTFIFEDSKGKIWFGGFGGLTELRDGKFINYTTKDGLAGNYIRTIYEDADGTFWIGTYDEGMSRFKDGKFFSYKTENGLANNGVFAIQEDRKGYFWISSNHGIYRVKRQELNDFAEQKISGINSTVYGKEDGMISTECNGGRQPATITDKDGKFWFPTQDGVVVVDSEMEKANPLPPSVVIEAVTVEREPLDIHKGISIEPGQKNIEIRYTGLSSIRSEQIKFKYKLEGHDQDWIDAGTKRTVYYSYLPPGHYTFHVKAANSDGVWNENDAQIILELKPFFYQTSSFYFICILIVALGLFVVWKISVYQLEARERRLMRLVSERTRELAEANLELQLLANSDGLTKIGNRRRFEAFLSDEWHRAVRFKTEISLILLDIDHFKLYNDSYGHQAGDDCLQKVAEALAETIHRPTDLVARFGGEEFAIILGGTDAEGAKTIAEQAMENVRNLQIPHCKSQTSEFLTISIGIATAFPKFEITEVDLIAAADKALYQAKETGRNQVISKTVMQTLVEVSVLEKKYLGIS